MKKWKDIVPLAAAGAGLAISLCYIARRRKPLPTLKISCKSESDYLSLESEALKHWKIQIKWEKSASDDQIIVSFQNGSSSAPVTIASIPLPDNRIYRDLTPMGTRKLNYYLQTPISQSDPDQEEEHGLHLQLATQMLRSATDTATFNCYVLPPSSHRFDDCAVHPTAAAKLFLFDVVVAGGDYMCDSSTSPKGKLNCTNVEASVVDAFCQQANLTDLQSMNYSDIVSSIARSEVDDSFFGSGGIGLALLLGECSNRCCSLVATVYDQVESQFGVLEYNNFLRMINFLFAQDHQSSAKEFSRIFRTMNRSRSGVVSRKEFAVWLARHLSKHKGVHPDLSAACILMSLRMPLLLFAEERTLWISGNSVIETTLSFQQLVDN